ncbi:hypothetical protein DNTS_021192, partial [Danionella cerebrum]
MAGMELRVWKKLLLVLFFFAADGLRPVDDLRVRPFPFPVDEPTTEPVVVPVSGPFFLVTFPSVIESGSDSKLCASLLKPNESLTLTVSLLDDGGSTSQLVQKNSRTEFHLCFSFQAPRVDGDSIQRLRVEVQGKSFKMTEERKVLFRSYLPLTFIQTDKPLYNPGQTVNFRVVTLDVDLVPLDQMVRSADNNNIRVAQWTNVSSTNWILELSYDLNIEAQVGMYTLKAFIGDRMYSQVFEVKKYVLPKFDVTVNAPQTVSVGDLTLAVEVCAKYTYGQPVPGRALVQLCREPYPFIQDSGVTNICLKDTREMNATGCAAFTVSTTVFFNTNSERSLQDAFVLNVSATYFNGTPIVGRAVYVLDANQWPNKQLLSLVTDQNGVASFSLNSLNLARISLNLLASMTSSQTGDRYKTPYFSTDSRVVQLQTDSSSSQAFSDLTILTLDQPLKCGSTYSVTINYSIVGEIGAYSVDIVYVVLSRGVILQNGFKKVQGNADTSGSVAFTLTISVNMAPVVQVLVYAVLPSRNVVAAGTSFVIEPCFSNKVSLQFSPPQAVPSEGNVLTVSAQAGSLCGLSAVDQSVLIMEPGRRLTPQSVLNLLPVQALSGYPSGLEFQNCPYFGFGIPKRQTPGKQVYQTFKNLGMMVATNLAVRPPPCMWYPDVMFAMPLVAPVAPSNELVRGEGTPLNQVTVRSYFPDTWIWQLAQVGASGSAKVPLTVPDTITTWETEAFCLSPKGFGLAPPAFLTAFQPFFLELTLPYSMVRGESLELKATVFNYLSQCLMVQVTPTPSTNFTLQSLTNSYSSCLCASGRKTFRWALSASVLGELIVTVSAQAVTSRVPCGSEAVVLPSRGRVDVVTRSLRVLAEGVERTFTQSWLLCAKGNVVSEAVSVEFPQNVVPGSSKCFVSVIGDIMGRALKNLESLLQLPSGCGEQNMIILAPNIYVLRYLEVTAQLTAAIRETAIGYLQTGEGFSVHIKSLVDAWRLVFNPPLLVVPRVPRRTELQAQRRLLQYFWIRCLKHMVGVALPFSSWRWLTAFVLRSFALAQSYIFIDPNVLQSAKSWLIAQQSSGGCFTQQGTLYHMDMKGGVGDDVTMTGYIVASLLELGVPVTDPVIVNGLSCLRPLVGNLGNTYTTALLAYTFSLAGETSTRSQLLDTLSSSAISEGNKLHWSQTSGSDTLAVEISSYVLLAVLTAQPVTAANLGYANRIVSWLVTKQNPYGGFSSTQDTVVALHALALYATNAFNALGSSSVTVQSSMGGEAYSFAVNPGNRLLYQEKPLKNVPGKYTVNVKGSSCVSVQVACFYNIPTPTVAPRTLSVEVKVTGDCKAAVVTLTLNFTVKYSGPNPTTNMVLVDVKLLSGFTADTTLLGSPPNSFAPLVQRVDSEDDHVLVYLEKVPKGVPMSYSMQLKQAVVVQKLKPAVVNVYDYYKTTAQNAELLQAQENRESPTVGLLLMAGMELRVWKKLLLVLFFFAADGLRPVDDLRVRPFPFPVDEPTTEPVVVPVSGPFFLVTFPSVIESGSDSKLCASLLKPNESLTLTVSLLDDGGSTSQLVQKNSRTEFHLCFSFQAPRVDGDSIQRLRVEVQGKSFKMTEERKVLFRSYLPLTFIQTDKPLYNPGQTVNFRVVTLDVDLVPLDQMVRSADNNNIRVAQWTNVSSTNWILELSYDLNIEAQVGMYTLKAFIGDRMYSQVFEVKKYVLPKFDVTVNAPQTVSVGDLTLAVEVCAKYTYGQPVPGRALVQLCREPYPFIQDSGVTNICLKDTREMNATGCAVFTVSTTVFFNTNSERSLQDAFVLNVSATYFNGTPIVGRAVYVLDANQWPNKQLLSLVTDQNGVASFSLNSLNLARISLNLLASMTSSQTGDRYKTPYFSTDSRVVQLQTDSSSSQAFSDLTILTLDQPLKCGSTYSVTINYSIVGEIGAYSVDIVYVVLSRGVILQNGFKKVQGNADTSGSVAFTLTISVNMAPVVQVLVYAVLPSRNVVAAGTSFVIEPCFSNKVSLQFSPPQAVPSEGNVLTVSAQAGSLCGLSAVDQSVLIMEPGRRLTPQSVLNLLPVQALSGYPSGLEFQNCPYFGFGIPKRQTPGKQVYQTFKNLGMMVATNLAVRPPPCMWYPDVMFAMPLAAPSTELVRGEGTPSNQVTVRSYFPDTWIWQLAQVGASGSAKVPLTVPDTITTWETEAFCLSPKGFGLAPPAFLTAFQPFFLELTLPYSMVRGESLELKATVFNYLSQCLMVQVTPTPSTNFTLQSLTNSYSSCLCASGRKTFRWALSASVLGELIVTVSAQAVTSRVPCGSEAVVLPSRGRVDVVTRSLRVLAEGVERTFTQSWLLCAKGNVVSEAVSVEFPQNVVPGSSKCFVSVIGDIMGRALKNLESLLQLPSGCGEQNMIILAPNIYVLRYLEVTAQLTAAIRETAIGYLQTGYQGELNYRHSDGSFSTFGYDASNTWLTAFVLRSFALAQSYIFIDPNVLQSAKSWLIAQQSSGGCFTQQGTLYHMDMKGGVGDDVTMTGYIVASLLELGVPVTDPVIVNGLSCLRPLVGNLGNTYTTALLAYTFSLAGETSTRSQLLDTLSSSAISEGNKLHWSQTSGSDTLAVEISSYVLLAVLTAQPVTAANLGYANRIVSWLVTKQNPYGGFSSTQDTVVALHALALYATNAFNALGSSSVTVQSSMGGEAYSFAVNPGNRLLYQEKPLKNVPGKYTVNVKGSSCVSVQVACFYNIPTPTVAPRTLSVEVKVTGDCKAAVVTLTLNFTVKYSGPNPTTNMVLVDVKLLSGFTADTTLLGSPPNSFAPLVQRVDSEDDHVLVYLEKVPKGVAMSYSMQLKQAVVVQKLKPAVVNVYDYYKTSMTL